MQKEILGKRGIPMRISFVIPCYNSQHNLQYVIDEIVTTVVGKAEYEIILVNDFSSDKTWEKIENLVYNDNHIKGLNLAKNFGQANALMAGFNYVSGDVIVTVEDDGQSSISYIWEMIALLNQNVDIVCARNVTNPKRSLFRKIGSKINKWMLKVALNVPNDISPSIFFVAKKQVIKEMIKYKNPYAYMAGLILRSTSCIANYDIHRRGRISGNSNYSFRKLLALWMNGITAFSIKPLRLSITLGLFCTLVSFLMMISQLIKYIVLDNVPRGYTSIFCMIMFLGGVIMVLLGIIGEYVGRIYMCVNNAPQYIIKEEIGVENDCQI